MGICSLVMGILMTIGLPLYLRFFNVAVQQMAKEPICIAFIAIVLGMTFLSLFLGIEGKKRDKTCATAGIVLSAIPLAIQIICFILMSITIFWR